MYPFRNGRDQVLHLYKMRSAMIMICILIITALYRLGKIKRSQFNQFFFVNVYSFCHCLSNYIWNIFKFWSVTLSIVPQPHRTDCPFFLLDFIGPPICWRFNECRSSHQQFQTGYAEFVVGFWSIRRDSVFMTLCWFLSRYWQLGRLCISDVIQ